MSRNAEEYIDSRIDKIVIALGDLYYAGIDIQKAWNIVCKSNMSKKRGVKKGREGSGGIDVYKDEDFIPVLHEGNHGNLDEIFTN
jgi:predicted HAD superfamily Cof-like phosphohydrolase